MGLRRLLSNLKLFLGMVSRQVIGSAIDERSFKKRTREDVRKYLDNVHSPHRTWLIDHILVPGPSGTLLELGCGWGPNLALLSSRLPNARLTGIDISPASIAEGTNKFKEIGVTHIRLIEGDASDLSQFDDDSMDIVFCDAFLLYVGPDKIISCFREMLRVAKTKIAMFEMHDEGAGSGGRYTRDGWVRDYKSLLAPLVGNTCVNMTKLPETIRTSGRWPIFGTLIEIDLRD